MPGAMDHREIAKELEQMLNLERPLVAISFREDSKRGLNRFDGTVSASCVFWTQALNKSFATSKEQHMNCSIGSVTHGFRRHEEIAPGCGLEDVEAFLELGWVTKEEVAGLPSYVHGSNTVSYGPMREVEFEPDVCCLFCNAEQALFLMTATDHAIVGKPACAAMAKALNEKRTVISMGCTASRTRAGYGPDELVAFIPAERLEEVVRSLRRVVGTERKVAALARAK